MLKIYSALQVFLHVFVTWCLSTRTTFPLSLITCYHYIACCSHYSNSIYTVTCRNTEFSMPLRSLSSSSLCWMIWSLFDLSGYMELNYMLRKLMNGTGDLHITFEDFCMNWGKSWRPTEQLVPRSWCTPRTSQIAFICISPYVHAVYWLSTNVLQTGTYHFTELITQWLWKHSLL